MIAACKTYLRGRLTAAGIPDVRVTDDPGQGEWPPPQVPFAELLAEPERLQRDGKLSAKEYDPDTQQATLHKRLFRRYLTIRVRLVHRDEAALDALTTSFLGGFARRIEEAVQKQWIYVRPQLATWMAGGPARDRRQVELRIDFEGGLYTTSLADTVQQINPPALEVN